MLLNVQSGRVVRVLERNYTNIYYLLINLIINERGGGTIFCHRMSSYVILCHLMSSCAIYYLLMSCFAIPLITHSTSNNLQLLMKDIATLSNFLITDRQTYLLTHASPRGAFAPKNICPPYNQHNGILHQKRKEYTVASTWREVEMYICFLASYIFNVLLLLIIGIG